MSDLTIRTLYLARLKAYAEDNGYPVSSENSKFVKTDERHLEIFFLPANTQSLSLDAVHRQFTGLVQINIVCPQNEGTGKALAIVKELSVVFVNALRLIDDDGVVVVITSPLSAATGFNRGSMFVVPTRFNYRSDTF